jgi:plasmid stabilization system protein ParE
MRVIWTREAVADLDEISIYYSENADTDIAISVTQRIVAQVASLVDFPERVRASTRVPGAREVVINKLPYIAFIRVTPAEIVVLNVVYTRRQFPPKM